MRRLPDDSEAILKRMLAVPNLAALPEGELRWLAEHGTLEAYEAGEVIAPMGQPIDKLWVIISGRVAIRVDRGVGPRRVMEWHPGDLGGMLPYSRMKSPPGHNYAEYATEAVTVPVSTFDEMTHRCPTVTARAVHAMIDRARSFNSSDLQDEKMLSLGRLAAGLAHELNNPAAATVRSAKALLDAMGEADAAARALGAAGLTAEQVASIEAMRTSCSTKPSGAVLSPIEQADREDTISQWLEDHDADVAPTAVLAETPITVEDLERIGATVSGESLNVTLRWIAAGCNTSALAADIERAATRISELVGAIKRFTHMDSLAGPESVDVEPGIRDTVRVLAAKARSKSASIALDIAPSLPKVRANGGELNQIWINLIDNALDAIPEAGRVEIRVGQEVDQLVVRVIDDGPGIRADVMQRIFDPFFTTKPPGQGTGLGLEISRRLARSYRGEITVESEPGRTAFAVSFPIEGSQAEKAGA